MNEGVGFVKSILFVCTGNTCRSPMAEALLREMAQARGVAVSVRSAGVSTVDGLPVSGHALESLRRRNVSHAGSSSRLTAEAVEWADLILTMTSGHKRDVLHYHPEAVDKTYTLKEFVYSDTAVAANISELEGLYSDMQMRGAIGGQLSKEERQRMLELEKTIPSFDIADPFGGSLSTYDSCSQEIQEAIGKLLDKLDSDSAFPGTEAD
jgi:protein-tyrosine phosphatase